MHILEDDGVRLGARELYKLATLLDKDLGFKIFASVVCNICAMSNANISVSEVRRENDKLKSGMVTRTRFHFSRPELVKCNSGWYS